jgi:chorismate mutase
VADGSARTPDTGVPPEDAASRIAALRTRIDAVDAELIRLWSSRAALSRQVGAVRVASGGTRVVLSREQEVVDTYREALGPDGASLAMLLLRAGRGPL